MNLILLEPDEIDDSGRARIGGARARHITQVLHTPPGGSLRAGIVGGGQGTATVIEAGDGHVSLECAIDPAPPQRPAVDLLLALPRPKVLRRLWAQIAAIGVGQIVLTNAARVERNYFDTHVVTPGFYRPLLVEGLQQARDTWLPAVSVHRQFKVLVEDHLDSLAGDSARLVAHPGAFASVVDAVRGSGQPRVLLAVGPEGGWNEFERHLLERHGFAPVALGPRPLRSDTATLVLLALAHEGLAGRDSRYPNAHA